MASERFERALEVALIDLAQPSVPDYLTDILGQTADTRQRPAWASIERWLPMDITTRPLARSTIPWRQLAIVAALIALVVAATALYVGTHQTRVPAPFGPAANGLIPFISNDDLYLGDPTTGKTRPLVTGPEPEGGPISSPDGTRVAFARAVAGTTLNDMWVVRIDGSDLHKVTPTPLDRLQWVVWAPAGDRLALIHEVGDPIDACEGCRLTKLDLVDTSGAGTLQTIATGVGMSSVKFRPPDGREVLYRALVDGKWGLYATDLDGRRVRTIVTPIADAAMGLTFFNTSYSADGRRIFFNQSTADASLGDPGCCQLFAVDADGGVPYKFVDSAMGTWDGDAVASPDGRWVAFWHNIPDRATQQIAVVAADGTGQVILTGPTLSGGAHWVWSPDSTETLMFLNNSDVGRAFLLDPAGGASTTVPWTSTADLDWQRVALP